MLYGQEVWDPVLIISKIIALQCIFYVGVGALMAMLVAPYAPRLALFHIFDWRQAGFMSFQGWMVCTAFFLNAFAIGIAIRFLVQRAKKCLDFSSTVYLIHFLAVSASSGFPKDASWWLNLAVDIAITAVLSEWLCLKQELKEIPLASIPRRTGNNVEMTSVTIQR